MPASRHDDCERLPRQWSSGFAVRSKTTTYDGEIEVLAPPPLDLVVARQNETSISLAWTDNSPPEDAASHYLIRFFETEKGSQSSETVTSEATSATVLSLQPDTDYTFVVRSIHGCGRGAIALVTGRTDAAPPNDDNDNDGGNDVCPLPELVHVGFISVSPNFPDAFESFTISWFACNVGATESGAFTDRVAVEKAFDDVEPDVFNLSVDSLPPGACYERFVDIPGLAPGSYDIFVFLDAENDVDECFDDYLIGGAFNANRVGEIISD